MTDASAGAVNTVLLYAQLYYPLSSVSSNTGDAMDSNTEGTVSSNTLSPVGSDTNPLDSYTLILACTTDSTSQSSPLSTILAQNTEVRFCLSCYLVLTFLLHFVV